MPHPFVGLSRRPDGNKCIKRYFEDCKEIKSYAQNTACPYTFGLFSSKGPLYERSNGCRMVEEWAGRMNTMMLLSLKSWMWESMMKRTGAVG